MNELIIDSFAGGGGASTGIEWAVGRSPDIAINHNAEALAMHRLNHPDCKHYQEDVWQVDPVEACAGRPVGLAWFSPDCTHFSKAKGGKPRSKKIRGLAWVVVRWAKAVRPRVICLENVEEFADWGPLLPDGKPDPIRKGLTFRRWHRKLQTLGYEVDMRELRACDYGAPTTRKRLFIIARCDGQPIVWPEATHGRALKPYRTAAECIDWSIPCPSIFERVKPLAEATLRRIARGVMRYVVNNPKPFIVKLRNNCVGQSLDEPLHTITGQAEHFGLISPTIVGLDHQSSPSAEHAADQPLTTVTAKARHLLVAPALINTRNGERAGQAPRVRDVRDPYPTVTAIGSQGGLVAAFLARHYGGHENDGAPMDAPLSTITTQDHHAQVVAFLIAYYGNEREGINLREPMRTVVSKDRFGLVTVHGEPHYIADIGMRMLVPAELFRAQGFPDDVKLLWTKTSQVRLCGNSVSPPTAAAIVRANYTEQAEARAA